MGLFSKKPKPIPLPSVRRVTRVVRHGAFQTFGDHYAGDGHWRNDHTFYRVFQLEGVDEVVRVIDTPVLALTQVGDEVEMWYNPNYNRFTVVNLTLAPSLLNTPQSSGESTDHETDD